MTSSAMVATEVRQSRLVGGAGFLALVVAAAWSSSSARAATVPTSMTITPTTAEIGVGQTQRFTTTLLDAANQETVPESVCTVQFAVDASTYATIAADPVDPQVGIATGQRAGATPVRSRYVCDGQPTDVFANANLTVTAADAGAVGSGGSGGAAGATGGAGGTAGAAGTGGGAGGTGGAPHVCSTASHTLCGTACVDTQKNQLNCGSCGVRCGREESCWGGTCQHDNGGCCSLAAGTPNRMIGSFLLLAVVLAFAARRRRGPPVGAAKSERSHQRVG